MRTRITVFAIVSTILSVVSIFSFYPYMSFIALGCSCYTIGMIHHSDWVQSELKELENEINTFIEQEKAKSKIPNRKS